MKCCIGDLNFCHVNVIRHDRLADFGIRNLHPVFDRGVRGETLARRCHKDMTLEGVRDAGIGTIIDLRTADHNDRLAMRCNTVGLAYHHIPVDAAVRGKGVLYADLPLLFDLLDGYGFYISCQQGLHRTDIALALYYFFHKDDEVPVMFGHRTKGFLRCDDIMRRINGMRPLFSNVSDADFAERRKRFLDANRDFSDIIINGVVVNRQ